MCLSRSSCAQACLYCTCCPGLFIYMQRDTGGGREPQAMSFVNFYANLWSAGMNKPGGATQIQVACCGFRYVSLGILVFWGSLWKPAALSESVCGVGGREAMRAVI